MKLPLSPPPLDDLIHELMDSQGIQRFLEVKNSRIADLPPNRYLHWDEMRHRTPPEGYSRKEWWIAKKLARQASSRDLPFKSKEGEPIYYCAPDAAQSLLHRIDRDASGRIEIPSDSANVQTQERYLIRSLIEEAITSSQLEGAATTYRVAKQMLQEGREPKDRNEQMIYNNYNAMQFIKTAQEERLTPDLILELQRILTEDTLDDVSIAGRWRRKHEDISVVDVRDGTVLHVPPDASQIPARIRALCAFANKPDRGSFIHPVIRAIMIHFILGYDHPFVDGNGRTARALFYWSMANQGYWMIQSASISTILRKAPSQYARAYLHSETDGNDATYFIIYHLKVIRRAIDSLHDYIARKAKEVRDTDRLLKGSPKLRDLLNHRQVNLLSHAMKHPYSVYRVESHRSTHGVTYETARTDLLELNEQGLLERSRSGRAYIFAVPEDLNDRLGALGVDT
jgi:Fic family protein